MKPKPKWIAAISPSKRASRAAYNREAKRVVKAANQEGLLCPVAASMYGYPIQVACIHHLRGKNCEELRHDKRGWMLVSISGHHWIDTHRSEARLRRWLCPVGKWGTPFKPGEPPMPGSVADMEARNPLHSQATDGKV